MAIGRNARVTGEERAKITEQLVARYAAGESIRSMADDLGRSYGWVQGLLKEAGVTFRARGGATRGLAGQQRAQVAWAGRTPGSQKLVTRTRRPAAAAAPDATPKAAPKPAATRATSAATTKPAPEGTVRPVAEPVVTAVEAPEAVASAPVEERTSKKKDKGAKDKPGKDKSTKDKSGKGKAGKGKAGKEKAGKEKAPKGAEVKAKAPKDKASKDAEAKPTKKQKTGKKDKGGNKSGGAGVPVKAARAASDLFARTDALADDVSGKKDKKSKKKGK